MTDASTQNVQISPAPSDWSHMKETVNMLYLAVCQIEATMTDSNNSVDTLTHSFTSLANHTSAVNEQIQKLHDQGEISRFKQDLASTTHELKSNVDASIQAFQFYDRVCQRLDHVARSLEKVSALMADENGVNNPTAWHNIQTNIKASYTMEAERIMFEYIMRGGTVKEALEIYRHHFGKEQHDDGNDEIELF